ncbi:uncharacterized protein LOC126266767 [Schistocerca gregaria]|uniref:uncharacterized protein LOC126266767 n=1 Tax=Schistocerca gregaria TaxID=7010 RepID=UPI00211EC9A4|nr:uncharacterized protein LOC126266767 [Schistocerca gregaria]
MGINVSKMCALYQTSGRHSSLTVEFALLCYALHIQRTMRAPQMLLLAAVVLLLHQGTQAASLGRQRPGYHGYPLGANANPLYTQQQGGGYNVGQDPRPPGSYGSHGNGIGAVPYTTRPRQFRPPGTIQHTSNQ